MYTRAFEYYCQNAVRFLFWACSYVRFSDSVITRKKQQNYNNIYWKGLDPIKKSFKRSDHFGQVLRSGSSLELFRNLFLTPRWSYFGFLSLSNKEKIIYIYLFLFHSHAHMQAKSLTFIFLLFLVSNFMILLLKVLTVRYELEFQCFISNSIKTRTRACVWPEW